MKVAVVGGGPGGLFFARLLKRCQPESVIRVFEQNAAGATFGFGVTLGGSSLSRLAEADPTLVSTLKRAMIFDTVQLIRLNTEDVPIEYAKAGGSIARLTLLAILREACLEVGVEIDFETRVARSGNLAGFDLIVAADGINSTMRQEYVAAFGTQTRMLTNHFAWFGVRRAMTPNALVFRNALGGRFVAHYYAYTPEMSTFVAECDDVTWRSAGLDRMTDTERRASIEQVFASELDGASLIENRSIWRQFAAVTNDRWYHGNIVLIGDALSSAHFSIGSGTRLAMEDAQSLVEACQSSSSVEDAVARFVTLRRPGRDQFGDAAKRSFEWYERLEANMSQSNIDFAYDFLTRTGRVSDTRLESYAPHFATLYSSHRVGAEIAS